MPGFEASTNDTLEKLLAAPPRPTPGVKGKMKAPGARKYIAYVAERTAWVKTVIAAGGTYEQAAAALNKVGHPTKALTLRQHENLHGGAAPREKKISHASKSDLKAVENLVNDLAERIARPILLENARLRVIEKKYESQKKLLAQLVKGEAA